MSDLNAAWAGGAPEEAAFLQGSIAHVSGREKWVLLVSMTAVFFVLLALYAAVLAVLLPNQIQAIDHANKTSGLAVVFAITYLQHADAADRRRLFGSPPHPLGHRTSTRLKSSHK